MYLIKLPGLLLNGDETHILDKIKEVLSIYGFIKSIKIHKVKGKIWLTQSASILMEPKDYKDKLPRNLIIQLFLQLWKELIQNVIIVKL